MEGGLHLEVVHSIERSSAVGRHTGQVSTEH